MSDRTDMSDSLMQRLHDSAVARGYCLRKTWDRETEEHVIEVLKPITSMRIDCGELTHCPEHVLHEEFEFILDGITQPSSPIFPIGDSHSDNPS